MSLIASRMPNRAPARLLGVLALAFVVGVPAATLRAQTAPAAADIVARHLAAVGGKDALLKVTSLKQLGRMEMPTVGLAADAEVMLAAPNKMSTKMTIPGLGAVENGTNGDVAWSMNPMQGPRLLADKELAQTKEQSDFYAALTFSPSIYASMETIGAVDFAGEKTYKVRFVSKATGLDLFRYFSVATGLLVGYELTTTSEMGNINATTVVSEYKEFGGIKFATRNETTMGPQKIRLTLNDVIINGAPETAFDVPDAVRPLIKK